MKLNPYVNFNGQCEQAFRFYEQVLGGKITFMMTWGEMPGADQFPAESHKLIMHATLSVGDGSIAFDDAVGEVSGTWVTGRKPAAEPGLLIYIMVDNVAATVDAVTAKGGKIVQPIGADTPEITARFSDPAGNVIGLYQQPAG